MDVQKEPAARLIRRREHGLSNRILTRPWQRDVAVLLVDTARCCNCGHMLAAVRIETPASILHICTECWDAINRTLKLKDAWA